LTYQRTGIAALPALAEHAAWRRRAPSAMERPTKVRLNRNGDSSAETALLSAPLF
jgi:hypothetical protein